MHDGRERWGNLVDDDRRYGRRIDNVLLLVEQAELQQTTACVQQQFTCSHLCLSSAAPQHCDSCLSVKWALGTVDGILVSNSNRRRWISRILCLLSFPHNSDLSRLANLANVRLSSSFSQPLVRRYLARNCTRQYIRQRTSVPACKPRVYIRVCQLLVLFKPENQRIGVRTLPPAPFAAPATGASSSCPLRPSCAHRAYQVRKRVVALNYRGLNAFCWRRCWSTWPMQMV